MRLGARMLAAARVEMAVTGHEHVPASGPALLVARHYHHLLDGVVLLAALSRPIHILMTLDWVKRSYARRLLGQGTAMDRWPVVRRGGAPAGERHVTIGDQRRGLDESAELLVEGRVLGKHRRWAARLRIGKAVYLEDFSSRELLVAHLERRVVELSGSVAAGSALEGS
jgi:hypothetical protein